MTSHLSVKVWRRRFLLPRELLRSMRIEARPGVGEAHGLADTMRDLSFLHSVNELMGTRFFAQMSSQRVGEVLPTTYVPS